MPGKKPLNRSGNDPLYNAWRNMWRRCTNPNTPEYKNYGGRGIKVCTRWDDFVLFATDMGPHPGKGWSLDRINNNGNYTPSNCRWANQRTQTQNRRGNVLDIERANQIRAIYKRGGKTITQIAKEFGVIHSTARRVIIRERWI